MANIGSSRWVHSSGVSQSDVALGDKPSKASPRFQEIPPVEEPKPSQILTFQRGLARAALELPEPEREPALREALKAMGILRRFYERERERDPT